MPSKTRIEIPTPEEFRRELLENILSENEAQTIPKPRESVKEWPDLKPLMGGLISDLPVFPLEALPEGIIREYTKTVTDVNQVDPGLAGVNCLGALSLAARGRFNVVPPSHSETLNLYLIALAKSGERKSQTVNDFFFPFHAFQEKEIDRIKPNRLEALNKREILRGQLRKLREDAIKGKPEDRKWAEEESMRVSRELESLHIPGELQLITSDSTEAALARLLTQNRDAMRFETVGFVSAEGGIIDVIGGLYSNKVTMDLFLKGHCGDTHTIHRKGDSAQVSLERPVMTMCLSIQPDFLETFKKTREFEGRGLLQRFLFAWCESRAGYRKLSTRKIPEDLKRGYSNLLQSILGIESPGVINLPFTDDAWRKWAAFYGDAEKCLLPGGELHHLVGWGSKLPGAVARIAGLFHLARSGREAAVKSISVDDVEAGITLGGFFADHARAVFSLMQESEEAIIARKILEAVKRHRFPVFKPRDILNTTGIARVKEMNPGLEILEHRGYIRKLDPPYSGFGRPEKDSYEVNPKIFDENMSA